MKVIITEASGEVIGVISNWQGALPREKEFIYHPPFAGEKEVNVMQVKSVRWRILRRPVIKSGHFLGHPEPYVELFV